MPMKRIVTKNVIIPYRLKKYRKSEREIFLLPKFFELDFLKENTKPFIKTFLSFYGCPIKTYAECLCFMKIIYQVLLLCLYRQSSHPE